jgi:hypothetical protein
MSNLKKLTSGIAILAAVAVVAGFLFRQHREQAAVRARLAQGAELAATYCSACHLQPPPEILPKRSWEAALGYMGFFLGMRDLGFLDDAPKWVRDNVASRQETLARDGALPDAPLLSEEDWAALRNYYVESAPQEALPQTGKPPLRRELPQFQVQPTRYHIPGAVTTLVHIREDRSEIYVGDAISHLLTVLDGDGRLKVTAQRFPEITPVDIDFIGETAYVASIGDLIGTQPSDNKPGRIAALPLVDQSIAGARSRTVIDSLYRTADMKIADLNEDGRMDFIVCGFGTVKGSVSWFEAQPDGSFREHVLFAEAGGVKAETDDFNGDGHLDIAVLMANAREGMHILINDGTAQFEDHIIFETHPAYGHTYFELHDFNDDGLTDFLVVNGDNVDSDPYDTRKNYHGVRVYLNRGDLDFDEAYFYPMYGAFIAKAADFDQDGDLDIAAISFYPDYSAEHPEAFTYLRNDGRLRFTPFTNEASNDGRWMTMDVGDVDGDGDADVVLGGAYIPVGMLAYPDKLQELTENGPSILLLKNTLR